MDIENTKKNDNIGEDVKPRLENKRKIKLKRVRTLSILVLS